LIRVRNWGLQVLLYLLTRKHSLSSGTVVDGVSDRAAKYVREADEAIYIGSIQNARTHPHQDIPLLIQTALKVKADAVHPGRLNFRLG
jgi:biotin carboxylase